MKKYLLTALFIFLSAPVYSADISYNYGLTANGFYGYTTYSDKYRQLYKHHHTPVSAEITTSVNYQLNSDVSFIFGLDGQISGGKEIEDYNHGKWGENIYAGFNTAYGELSIGQIYNAAYQMSVGAPGVGSFRVNNSPITDFIANPNWRRHSRIAYYATLNSTYLNTDADAPKISYTTPEFYNTKMAFSYAPESYSQAGLVNKHSAYDNRSSYAIGIYNDLELQFIEIESSLGYAYNKKNNQEISAGLSLYRKGWTLGGSYRKSFTASGDYALNKGISAEMPMYFDGYRRGQAFNVGLSYEIGPFKTGVSYFYAKADKTSNRDNIITLANRFSFNKYLAFYLASSYAEYKGNKNALSGNRGYAFIGGVELNI